MSRNEKKEQTRQRMVEAAGRGFRQSGFGGMGVDALAKAAGVTSGAFYVHFGSKAQAFHEAVVHGMADLKSGVLYFQTEHGENWWPEFVRFYLGSKRSCYLAESCSLQSLSPEVARSDDAAKEAFESALRDVAQTIVNGPRSPRAPRDIDTAYAALASLIGAVTLARAVQGGAFADQLAQSVGKELLGPSWLERN